MDDSLIAAGGEMMSDNANHSERHNEFVKNLVAFAQPHRANPWSGTFGEFLEKILPGDSRGIARNSHQYIWDMIRWQGYETNHEGQLRYKLFAEELFGIDDALERLADYFKAASAGSRNTATPMKARSTPFKGVRCTSRRCILSRIRCGRSSARPTALKSSAICARCAGRAPKNGAPTAVTALPTR